MPSISVIVPAYKVEKYINRCVDSILAQTFDAFELILVDDGSPDKSGEICEDYAKKDTRVSVIHKENGGLSSARNAGIDIAKGEYLLFVDGDDIIHPRTLEILYSQTQKTNSEIVLGNFSRFKDESEIYFKRDKLEPNCEECSDVRALENLYDRNIAPKFVSACGKLIKRSLFDDVRFPIGRLFEDEFTTYKLYYQAEKVVVVEQTLYYYFVNDEGITRNLTLQKYLDEYDAQWERILFYKEKNLKDVYQKALLHFLESAKWSLLAWRNNSEKCDETRGKFLDKQYREVFKLAEKEEILQFANHYDYYVLGNPKCVLYYRAKRLIKKFIARGLTP